MKNVLIILFVAIGCSLSAQTDTGTDSVNNALLRDYQKKMDAMRAQHREDSIKRDQLEKRLTLAAASEQQSLQEQLAKLKNADSLRLASKKKQIDSLRAYAKGYPVKGPMGENLFTIYSRLGSFSGRIRRDDWRAQARLLASDDTAAYEAKFGRI